MKLLPLLLLVSVAAFAQQKDKPVKVSDYELDENTITWDEIFREGGFYTGPSPYADTVLARKMQEWYQSQQPYIWIGRNNPIVVDDSTYQWLISSDNGFRKSYQRADSLMRVNDEQRKLKQKTK